MTPRGITPRMLACLDAIKRLTVRGVPPSFEELGDALSVSKGNVHRLLHDLRARGLVAFEARQSRTLRLIETSPLNRLDELSDRDLSALRRRVEIECLERAL